MTEGQTSARDQFLKDNKLGDVVDIFVKRDITIEELLEFDKPDLRQFAKELGLDALSQNRLVKAVGKLCPAAAPAMAMGMGISPMSSSGTAPASGSTGFASFASFVILKCFWMLHMCISLSGQRWSWQ